MDRLLQGILNSDKPAGIKKNFIAKIAAASNDAQPTESVTAVLRTSLMFIVDGETESMMALSQPVFVDWASNHQLFFVEFFSESLASDLLQNRYRRPLGVIWVVDFSLGLIHRNGLATYTGLCHTVAVQASCFASYNVTDFEVVKSFCSLLLVHRECVPEDDSLHTLVTILLRAVSRFNIPSDSKAVKCFIDDVPNTIGKLLHEIWVCDSDVVANTLQTIFDIVTERSSTESMSSLGAVIQFVPDIVMRSTLQSKACDALLSDETALLALSRMLDMLCWPSTKNIDAWIITFMHGLASVHRYSVLLCIAGSKVDQVFEQLKYPLVQCGFFNVMSYMLLSVQHSPVVFHKIVGSVPDLVSSLRQQNTKESSSLLNSLVELIDCLMFQHPGFPDLYEPVVDALKDFAHPSSAVMREILKQYAWSSASVVTQSTVLDDVEEMRSDTGLTGLCNLGNTCYINSVLQALYMCDSFRRDVLSTVPSASQPSLMSMQQVFAFLSGTQRSAYSPEKFVQESRPSWFMSGVQQDCSEFLRYLLNTVHEQEMNSCRQMSPVAASSQVAAQKSTALPGLFSQGSHTVSSDEGRSPPSLVERSFGGLLSMTCRCLQCGTASSRTESFMDLAVAIPTESHPTQPAVSASASSSSHGTPAMVGGSPLVTSGDHVQTTSSSSSLLVESLSLNSLLHRFLMPERLDGDNQYHCDGPCNSLQDGERHVEICAAPTYLIVTLMRFSYDAQNGSHSKIFTDIQYPLILSVPVRSEVQESAVDGFCQETYGLVGVIVHSGLSSDAGHYFCYARHTLQPADTMSFADSAEDCFADQWYMFNDSRVTRASFDNIRNLTHKFSHDTAYMLIYRCVDTVEKSADVDVTDGFALDPPLHRYLRDTVDEDNRLYFQEKERRQRSRLSVRSESRLKTFSHHRNRDDDDDDNVPPGGMNSGFGSFHNGPRVIF